MKQRILFLCTANSCRSQMAEGIVNHFLGNRFEASSAGTLATFVNPRATKVLREWGIDISGNRSKSVAEFDGQGFDHVITLCGSARDNCPLFFGGARTVHIGFDDPAAATGSEEEIMAEFRRVRDDIKVKLCAFLAGS